MLAKKEEIQKLGRLKKRSDFLCVQAAKTKWVSQPMIVEIRPNEDMGIRYGLTVSKRVSKLAVIRNRIKRRLKAAACDVLPCYSAQHFDIVLVGRQAAQDRSYDDLTRDLHWCLKRLGLKKSRIEKNA